MEKNKIEKTNIVKLARFNRKAAADAKYYIYNKYKVIYLYHWHPPLNMDEYGNIECLRALNTP